MLPRHRTLFSPRARVGCAILSMLVAVVTAGCAAQGATLTLPATSAPVPTGSVGGGVGSAVPVPRPPSDTEIAFADSVPRLAVEVQRVLPHDPSAFTQGLVAATDDRLFESTGLYGESSLREVELDSGRVVRRQDLPPDLFAEGLALVDDRLVQLTWREEVALVHSLATFDLEDTVRYEGEGWGLCYDGARLVMSDGSDRLAFRDPATLEATGGVSVTAAGQPVTRLNELECVDERVYANIWQTDWIVEIDAATGDVLAAIDASGLLEPAERTTADVLNGIAHRASSDTFLVTGKLWPKLFEVRFVPMSDD